MDITLKRFPPHGGLLVPLGSRGAAAGALSAYAACRPGAALARRAAAGWVRILGPGRLPGHAEAWHPPLPDDAWTALLETLRGAVPFDALAVLERRQPDRAGFALLLLRGSRAAAFVKLRPLPAAGVHREAGALERLARAVPRAFSAPALLARGTAGAWGWLAATALPGPHHVPRAPRLPQVAADVRRALADLPRPNDVPAHWMPMHGDLTPWNLREAHGRLLLYDWERAAWAPPGADEVLYRVAEAALYGGRRPREARWLCARWPEAAAFWAARLRARRPAGPGESRLLANQLAILSPTAATGTAADETRSLTAPCRGGIAGDDQPGLGDVQRAAPLALPGAGG